MKQTMAMDQHGNMYCGLGEHPRKALLKRFGTKRAEKMYCDTKSGETKHVGYIISGLWLTIYEVTEWTGGKVR